MRTLDPASWLDEYGVLLKVPDEQWVYRALTTKGEEVLRHIQKEGGLEALTKAGLVETEEVCDFGPICGHPDLKTVIRHRRIAPVVFPMEWTMAMWREALRFLCRFHAGLIEHGLALGDAHAYNILFKPDGQPVFIDFGSLRIGKGGFGIRRSWHREFSELFLLPLLLNKLFRRAVGTSAVAGGSPMRSPLLAFHTLYEIARLLRKPGLYWRGVERLLCGRYVAPQRTNWTSYAATGEGWKGEFIRTLLPTLPGVHSVLDLAGNKGTYALHAARLGKRTLLADIDEASLDQARATARRDGIPLQVAHLDLCNPTAARGLGLLRPGCYERFRSDVVLALAVSHHLAFRRQVPFHTFAEIISRFATRYIITEFVGLGDEHVVKWLKKGRQPPRGYSDEQFAQAFADAGWRVAKRDARPDGHRVLYLFERHAG